MTPIPAANPADIYGSAYALGTYGAFPVKVCRVADHKHPKDAEPCRTPGKRPWESAWQKTTAEEGFARLDDWVNSGWGVGIVPVGDLLGMDEDVVGGLEAFFESVGESVPRTIGDVVPLTGKRHIWVKAHPSIEVDRLASGDFRVDGAVLGEVARSGARHFVLPGNVWRSGDQYDVREWNKVETVATLSERATLALLAPTTMASPRSLGRPEPSSEWQWDISMGSRHNLIVKEARRLSGAIRSEDILANQMLDWSHRHGLIGRHPETGRYSHEQEVRDAVTSALQKFDEDPEPITLNVPRVDGTGPYVVPVVIPTSGLFVNVIDYHAAQPTAVEWVSPLAAYGFVSLIAGPPKAGKSTLVSNLLSARETGSMFLWGDPVPQGPMALVTEEGGLAVVRKTQGLTTLDILDRRNFFEQGLKKLDHLLDALMAWCGQRERALLVIDTLAIWGDIKDENDATAATQAVASLTLLAQQTQCAMALVHHARKGGGDHGEGIRGSGAIFATVDQAIELNYVTDKTSDNRLLSLAGRLIFPELHELAFDRGTNTYETTTSTWTDPYPIDQFPTSTSGKSGLTRQDVETIWAVSASRANEQLKVLVASGRLTSTAVKDGRITRNEYHRVLLLDLSADTRSVGERMASIYEEPDATDATAPKGAASASVASDPKAVGDPASGEEPESSGT